ncbi:SAV_6107 family HEPN domain-containing protein [Oerskovia flava]|uniref:SAV_6107 family HEPN domain-containing protein n=1 Tax=Oerskovia flava TaxID=2986422 RepID=UPI00223FF36F|nr:SAV_6107 family HEPN domain-containing protein [Oerskovia sp. JB1-3-2]
MTTHTQGSAPTVVPAEVGRIMVRADAELVQASLAVEPAERFVHAHLGALRAAAAVVALRAVPHRGRSRSKVASVWDRLAVAEPALAPWSVYFASGARVRAAVDAGRFDAVDARRADELMACAEDFRDEVAMLIDPDTGFVRHPHLTVAGSVRQERRRPHTRAAAS